MKIEDYLKGKFVYDNYGQFIWLVQSNGHNQKIADLRAWGAIQNLFKQKSGKIDMDKAAKFQDELGEWIASSLNKSNEVEQEVEEENYSNMVDCFHAGFRFSRDMANNPSNSEYIMALRESKLKSNR